MEKRKLAELKAINPYLRLGTDVTDLEKSIGTLGLIAPLVISEENLILAGARRYQALLNLGHTETAVIVVKGNELEQELVSIDENLVRKDLSKIEVESHLRRAKEIYQKINQDEQVTTLDEAQSDPKKITLPAEKFLNMVSEKTGLSPRQIHEAINRDEMASPVVKEARKNGELSLSQTNEIVKLKKSDQKIAIDHIKDLPVREIKKFVKLAHTNGVEKAILATPQKPYQREFQELDQNLKKLIKKMKQLQLEGIEYSDLPTETEQLFTELMQIMEEQNHIFRVSSNGKDNLLNH